ncbi:cation/calcium exchanger 5 [Vitis vinifera]|uniref:cation/calcium exchanger 5 n=1 Tax=Vitis vinifera TaxID=29760 RepID=UPI00023B345B|nr:cation/calcium exchanger 5 [Vitis vinifera]|eukprot:XP_003633638.1 PREDICTED: cation/calcium exchanger 5 [Vitis vinifera]
MACFSSSSSSSLSYLKNSAIPLSLFFIFLFFLLTTPHFSPSYPSPPPIIPKRSLLNSTTTTTSCSSSLETPSNGLLNYLSLHFCTFHQTHLISIPFLTLVLLLLFYILVKTAQDRFSIVVTKLCAHLNLSPSMGAVTLLALGNGAPDVFASVAAVRGGHPRTGFGAILSAGTFVSAFVVGFVAIYAAPFSVDPSQFVRDVFFYLVAALFLFYVYLSAEIFLWQAIGFVGFYAFFVGLVFWMDLGIGGGKERGGSEVGLIGEVEIEKGLVGSGVFEIGDVLKDVERGKAGFGFGDALGKISKAWELPVSLLLKLTIPQTEPSEWNRFYQSANIALCPLALLYSCNSFIPLNHPIIFLLPHTHFPLWSVVLFASSSLAVLHFIIEKEPPETERMPVVLVAFIMSVFWISTVAGELLNCLAALGSLLELPPSLLGLTVLAWGNSVGDLVADVAIAKAGQPAMAMAGCFAGPMFNMLVGLGTALVIQTANIYPQAYQLHFHTGIVIAFVFLLSSLMGSLLVITWGRFRVPRFWGFCLVGLYVVFMVVSILIAKFSG